MEEQMRDRDTDSNESLETLLERERHRRMEAEEKIKLATGYLNELGFSPLKAKVLRILEG